MNRRGQFIILTAVLVTVSILILAAMTTNANVRISRSQEAFLPVSAINVMDDAPRAFKVALKLASQTYNSTGLSDDAMNLADNFIGYWLSNFTYVHGGRGVAVNVSNISLSFQWSNGTSWRSTLSGQVVIFGSAAGFSEINRTLREGVVVSDLSYDVDSVNVTAYDFGSGVGVKLNVLYIKIDDMLCLSWHSLYLGSGSTFIEGITLSPDSKIEILFSCSGILVKVLMDH